MTEYELQIFADYNQIYVEDLHSPADPADPAVIDAVIDDLVAAQQGRVILGTARRMTVPVTVQLRDTPPSPGDTNADHITEASLTISSGTLAVRGPSDQTGTLLTLAPGTYRLRAVSTGLDTLTEDALDGDDHYQLTLWPSAAVPPEVLTHYPHLPLGG